MKINYAKRCFDDGKTDSCQSLNIEKTDKDIVKTLKITIVKTKIGEKYYDKIKFKKIFI